MTYIDIGDGMMVVKIRKMQFLCGLCLLMQFVCFKWMIPFHLMSVLLSIIVMCNQRKYKVIQVQYHYYIIALYILKLWILSVGSLLFFELMYMVLCLYVSVILILFSFHCLF